MFDSTAEHSAGKMKREGRCPSEGLKGIEILKRMRYSLPLDVSNTEGLGLEKLGIQMNGRFIQIDKSCRTNIDGIYAIGDVAGNPMLAHKASHEGEVVAEVIAGHDVQNEAKTVPAVVFTDPEIATAGLQEPEAKAQGFELKVG